MAQKSGWFEFKRSVHDIAHVDPTQVRIHWISSQTDIFASSSALVGRQPNAGRFFQCSNGVCHGCILCVWPPSTLNLLHYWQRLLLKKCSLDALEFVNERSFQHCWPIGFISDKQYGHLCPLFPSVSISIQLVSPTKIWIMCESDLEDQWFIFAKHSF